MSNKHTPEPWQQGRLLKTRQVNSWSDSQKQRGELMEKQQVCINFSGFDQGRGRLIIGKFDNPNDTERAIACVNALTNIPDPEQWVADMKAENTILKAEIDKLREQRLTDGLDGQARLDEDGNLISTLKAENERLKHEKETMLKGLSLITEGVGRYSLDPLKHASNCIEDMIELAKNTIEKVSKYEQ